MLMRLARFLVWPVLIGCCLMVAGQPAATPTNPKTPDETGNSISGRVMTLGKGLGGATVTLWHQSLAEPTSSNFAGSAQTDIEGNYRLAKIPRGSYFIRASAPGYVNGSENNPFALKAINLGVGETLSRIDLDVTRGGVITGKVTNTEGQPLIEQTITLIPQPTRPDLSTPAYASNIRTDDRGVYRIFGIPPGKYKVAAGPALPVLESFIGRVAYPRSFYPDVAEEAKAAVIEVTSGIEVSDVDIKLAAPPKMFSVSGRVFDGETGQPIANISFSVEVYSGDKRVGGFGPRDLSNSKGEFTLRSLPAGTYVISAPRRGLSLQPITTENTQLNVYGDAARVEVVDKDVSGIEIRTARAGSVSGNIVIEGTNDKALLARVPQMRLMVFSLPKRSGMGSSGIGAINPDGSFTVTGLRPGSIRFSFLSPPTGGPLPIRFIRTERDGVKLPQEVELNAGEEIERLQLVFAYATGSIHGSVSFGNSNTRASGGRCSARLIRNTAVGESAMIDARGRFLIEGLPVGEYNLTCSSVTATPDGIRSLEGVRPVGTQISVTADKVSEVTLAPTAAP